MSPEYVASAQPLLTISAVFDVTINDAPPYMRRAVNDSTQTLSLINRSKGPLEHVKGPSAKHSNDFLSSS